MKILKIFAGIFMAAFLIVPMARAEYCPPESMRGEIPDEYFENCEPNPEDVGEPSAEDAAALEAAKAEVQAGIDEVKSHFPDFEELVQSAKENDIPLGDFETQLEQAKSKIEEAETHIANDDPESAGNLVTDVQDMDLPGKAQAIQSQLNALLDDVDVDQVLADTERTIKTLHKLRHIAQIKMIETDEFDEMIDVIQPLYDDLVAAVNAEDNGKIGSTLKKIRELSLKEKIDYFVEQSNALDFKEAFAQIERSIQIAEKAIAKAKEMDKDYADVQTMVEKAEDWLEEAKAKFNQHAAPEEIGAILDKIEALPWDENLDALFQSLHEDSVKSALQESFGVAEDGIEKMDGLIADLKAEDVDTEPVENLAQKIKDLLARAKALFEEGKYMQAGHAMDQLASLGDTVDNFLERYRARLNATELEGMDFAPLKQLPQDFMDGFNESTAGGVQDMFQAVSKDNRHSMMQFIVGQGEDAARELALLRDDAPESVDKLFGLILKAPENYRRELIEQKKRLVRRTGDLQERVDALKNMKKLGLQQEKQLQEVIQKIRDYNFPGESGAVIAAELENFIAESMDAGMTRAQINIGVTQLMSKYEKAVQDAVREKFEQGIIPFKDTDDQAWYTDFVRYVKDNEVVSGYKDANGNPLGEFRPGNNVTIAEILKISLEGAGLGQGAGDPALSQARNHWAKGYVKKGEELGLTLLNGRPDINRPATRGEVIRLILEAFNIQPASTADRFPDIAGDPNRFYIQKAAELGIVSGNPDGTFKPGNPINRAEASKIMKNAIEFLFR